MRSSQQNQAAGMPAQIKRQTTLASRALILDPTARIRTLSEHGSSVTIDKDIPVKRYFRSGSEMERQVKLMTLSHCLYS